MIPEAAKRFVEQIGFDEKSKSLLSGCLVHRCHVIHLLRREVHPSLSEGTYGSSGKNRQYLFFRGKRCEETKTGQRAPTF